MNSPNGWIGQFIEGSGAQIKTRLDGAARTLVNDLDSDLLLIEEDVNLMATNRVLVWVTTSETRHCTK